MNLFVLDLDPTKAATMACDRHVIKMTLETAQLLCSAFPVGVAPYRPTHINHPCSVWVRTSSANYDWALEHGLALAKEYTKRYGKIHASEAVLNKVASLKTEIRYIKSESILTPFAQAMAEELQHNDPVVAYQRYYLRDKAKFATWTEPSIPPDWWNIPMVLSFDKKKNKGCWKVVDSNLT